MKEEIISSMIDVYEHRIRTNIENLGYNHNNDNPKYVSFILHENEICNMCIIRLKERLNKLKK